MKNLYRFRLKDPSKGIMFLMDILQHNTGAWGYLDCCHVYVVGSCLLPDDFPFDSIDAVDCLSEVTSLLLGNSK